MGWLSHSTASHLLMEHFPGQGVEHPYLSAHRTKILHSDRIRWVESVGNIAATDRLWTQIRRVRPHVVEVPLRGSFG
jgi:hypothetical protein